MTLFRRLFIIAILCVFAAGCSDSSSPNSVFEEPAVVPDTSGDSGGDEPETPVDESESEEEAPAEEPMATILVTPSLGLINGAEVSVTQADGTAIEGAVGTLDTTGTVSISHDGSYDGPILVTITGTEAATYFDEAAGANLPMGSDVTIRAFAPSPLTEIGVTILTELAAQVMDDVEGTISADTVNSVNNAVREALAPDLPDILIPPAIVSEENLTAQSLTTIDADTYALRLAALANIAAGDEAPAVSILQQLAADLEDGDIDGEGVVGPLSDLDYTAETFESLFANALNLAASTLADADLVAAAGSLSVSLDANVLEEVIAAGVGLAQAVVDLINPPTDGAESEGDSAGEGEGEAESEGEGEGEGEGESEGETDSEDDSGGGNETPIEVPDVDISGNYDLTISGEIITFGIATAFDLVIENIIAPSPSDTAEITQVIEDTVGGVSGITNLQITIINNREDRITFDVSFTAQQSGVEVTMNLQYDYVPSGTSSDSSGDSGSSNEGLPAGSDSGTGSEEAIAALGQVCFFGGEPEAVSIPTFLTAQTWELRFTSAQPGAPYAEDDVHTFLFSSSGRLFVDDVEIANTPVICNGNEREAIWKDTTNNLIYSVSDLTGSFNEVNVGRGDDGGFLGQFIEN
ncbi:MAG: hypothetical protein JJ956_08590 [Pseudomonadales bacterium]|nr:hypothetical protein [Pseudomonadales bacterium]